MYHVDPIQHDGLINTEDDMATYITDAEAAKTIRREIKAELGLNARQVSVRCRTGSIDVTIKVPHAKKPIQAIAARQEIVRRCEYSGDILSGGNRFVSVSYGAGAFDEIIKAHELVAVAERALAKPRYIMDIEGQGAGLSVGENGGATLWLDGSNIGHSLDNGWGTDDPRRIAAQVAEALLNTERPEPATAPEPAEADETDETPVVELPAEIVDAAEPLTDEEAAKLRELVEADCTPIPGQPTRPFVAQVASDDLGRSLIARGLYKVISFTQGHLTDAGFDALVAYDAANRAPREELAEQEPEEIAADAVIVDGKIQPARIVFNWSGSNAIGNGETFETFGRANAAIHAATGFAPAGGAYDKTDFTIHYTDGNTYHGRIDITRSMGADLSPLTSHIRNFQRAMTGDHCPLHMDQRRYSQMIANAELREPGTRQAARDFLANYALTDPTPTADEFESKQATFMAYLGA